MAAFKVGIVLFLALTGCTKSKPRPDAGRCIAPLGYPPEIPAAVSACPAGRPFPPLTRGQVVAAGSTLTVELALTPEATGRGLMYRTYLPENEGMLFHMSSRRVQHFWMQNTCIPLDMIFIDADGTVVGIVEAAPPLNTEPRSVPCPSSWVLEVNAGWARKHNLKPGAWLQLPAIQ